MISGEKAEPKGSEPSSTECASTHPESGLRCTKSRRLVHLEHVNGSAVWDDRDYEPEPSPEECSHLNKRYTGSRYEGSGRSFVVFFCPACRLRGVEEEPPLTPEEEEEASEDACTCADAGACFVPLGHYRDCPCAPGAPEDEEGLSGPCDCGEGAVHYTAANCPFEQRRKAQELPPPEGPEYTPCVCEHEPSEHAGVMGTGECGECECVVYRTEPDFELPPQPDRRPPYAVSYSVLGHLYEVALPGDATVRAMDGALVIQHHLGPVAAICSVLPVIDKESNA